MATLAVSSREQPVRQSVSRYPVPIAHSAALRLFAAFMEAGGPVTGRETERRRKILTPLHPAYPNGCIRRDQPLTLDALEAHIITGHLDPVVAHTLGMPVFDLRTLAALGQSDRLARIRAIVMGLVRQEEGNDPFSAGYAVHLLRILRYLDHPQLGPRVDWAALDRQFPELEPSRTSPALTRFEVAELIKWDREWGSYRQRIVLPSS